jgi:hypothetical protein
VTEVIEATPPGASAPKMPAIESTAATEAVPSEAATEEARAEDAKSEDVNLESIAADIDKMLLNMAAEEAAVVRCSPSGLSLTGKVSVRFPLFQ